MECTHIWGTSPANAHFQSWRVNQSTNASTLKFTFSLLFSGVPRLSWFFVVGPRFCYLNRGFSISLFFGGHPGCEVPQMDSTHISCLGWCSAIANQECSVRHESEGLSFHYTKFQSLNHNPTAGDYNNKSYRKCYIRNLDPGLLICFPTCSLCFSRFP